MVFFVTVTVFQGTEPAQGKGSGSSSSPGNTSNRDPNFRKKLIKETGQNPPNADAHHNLPVKLAEWLKSIGLDVNKIDFGSWFDRVSHKGTNSEFIKDWESFKEMNIDATADRILNFARDLAMKYGVKPRF